MLRGGIGLERESTTASGLDSALAGPLLPQIDSTGNLDAAFLPDKAEIGRQVADFKLR